ncbi:MAG: hypothetical protein ACRDSK_26355, partial [Actinophytocola sp.]|uniref:hypothetical protein n=1 Tax=Actinophytocola sp. TaxID=1872138 RepID=UPI003D6B29B1
VVRGAARAARDPASAAAGAAVRAVAAAAPSDATGPMVAESFAVFSPRSSTPARSRRTAR